MLNTKCHMTFFDKVENNRVNSKWKFWMCYDLTSINDWYRIVLCILGFSHITKNKNRVMSGERWFNKYVLMWLSNYIRIASPKELENIDNCASLREDGSVIMQNYGKLYLRFKIYPYFKSLSNSPMLVIHDIVTQLNDGG